MHLDKEIDAAYPKKWKSTVTVYTHDGRELRCAVQSAKGDPEKPLSKAEIEQKVLRLAQGGNNFVGNLPDLIQRIYQMHDPAFELRNLLH